MKIINKKESNKEIKKLIEYFIKEDIKNHIEMELIMINLIDYNRYQLIKKSMEEN